MTDDRPVPPGLEPFWSGTVRDFAQLAPNTFTPQDQERHRVFSLLVLAMIYSKWNGNKYGEIGDYGTWRAGQEAGTTADGQKVYGGGTYEGHNIAALAVDGEGRIIDFDFNHNAVFDSTVEHAESRLVRRVFALNQIYDPWQAVEGADEGVGARHAARPRQRRRVFATAVSDRPAPARTGLHDAATAENAPHTPPQNYSTLLKDVTIYTSLESCAQCSGIMCLGSVKDIVYLQWDQGQFLVGNIMRRATTAQQMGFSAPRPVRGDEFGFEYFTQLNEAAAAFDDKVPSKPFYRQGGFTNASPSVTSFLCTDDARAIYRAGDAELASWTTAQSPDHQPTPTSLTNQQVLDQGRDFRIWVGQLENRGAPHRV